ncbi:MAG: hypothetical protein ACQEXC_13035, partial [Pseudomonadota bacterium]
MHDDLLRRETSADSTSPARLPHDTQNAKSPDHLTMIGAFLNKCLTMTRAALRYSPWRDPGHPTKPETTNPPASLETGGF